MIIKIPHENIHIKRILTMVCKTIKNTIIFTSINYWSLTILTTSENLTTSRLAPPIRNPFTPSIEISSFALVGLTEPPYRIGVFLDSFCKLL